MKFPVLKFTGSLLFLHDVSPAPVSYTHLDVYKRQVLDSGFATLCFHKCALIGVILSVLGSLVNSCLLYTSAEAAKAP